MSGAQEERPAEGSASRPSGRRSGRIIRRVAILLFGYDEEGHTFTERTHTVVLSQHGAGILSTHRFTPEQELILRVEETQREAEVRVVGEIGTEEGLHTFGVAFLKEDLDFWRVEFPQAPASEEQPRVLPLECGACGERVEVAQGEFEYDISQIHGGLTRHCTECGTLTVWRRADGKWPSLAEETESEDKPVDAQGKHQNDSPAKERRFGGSAMRSPGRRGASRAGDPFLLRGKHAMDAAKPGWRDEVSDEPEIADMEVDVPRAGKNFSGLAQGGEVEVPERAEQPEPVVEQVLPKEEPVATAASEPARDPGVERRRRTRAKVNFFACVKTAQFGMDIVTCLDMSKGGVGFRGRNRYTQGMKIEIAVPYAPEVKDAPAIFVSGRIANVREVDGMWRCGVEFLKGA